MSSYCNTSDALELHCLRYWSDVISRDYRLSHDHGQRKPGNQGLFRVKEETQMH